MTYHIGTSPDPYKVIERQKSRIDLLTQELMLATEKPYRGFWRGVMIAAVLFGALGFAAGRAFADPLSIRGTTVTLEPAPPPAVAVVTMNNLSVNDDRDNGVYFVAMPGLLVEVEFTWNAGIAGSDRITVLPPDGFVCEPRDCAATVLENDSGTVLLLEWIGG